MRRPDSSPTLGTKTVACQLSNLPNTYKLRKNLTQSSPLPPIAYSRRPLLPIHRRHRPLLLPRGMRRANQARWVATSPMDQSGRPDLKNSP
jgi:hypothetical protein